MEIFFSFEPYWPAGGVVSSKGYKSEKIFSEEVHIGRAHRREMKTLPCAEVPAERLQWFRQATAVFSDQKQTVF